MAVFSPRFRSSPRVQKASENSPPLRQGESSDGVRILQQALVDLGHAMPRSRKEDDYDGIYGPETSSTVRRFQQKNFLGADGIAGRQTFTCMDRIFLQHDPRFGDPNVEKAMLLAQLSGSPGRGPLSCTTARKNRG